MNNLVNKYYKKAQISTIFLGPPIGFATKN
jgi:hypothetical protein